MDNPKPITTTTAADYCQVRKGLELSVDDLIETRHGGERMYVPRKRTKNRVSDQQIAIILLALILAVVIAIVLLIMGD